MCTKFCSPITSLFWNLVFVDYSGRWIRKFYRNCKFSNIQLFQNFYFLKIISSKPFLKIRFNPKFCLLLINSQSRKINLLIFRSPSFYKHPWKKHQHYRRLECTSRVLRSIAWRRRGVRNRKKTRKMTDSKGKGLKKLRMSLMVVSAREAKKEKGKSIASARRWWGRWIDVTDVYVG